MEMLIETEMTGRLLYRGLWLACFGCERSADLDDRLPFAGDNGSGLGIAAKTYLDAVSEDAEPTDALKTAIKHQDGKYNWFQQLRGNGHLTKSLDQAWTLWDAVCLLELTTDLDADR